MLTIHSIKSLKKEEESDSPILQFTKFNCFVKYQHTKKLTISRKIFRQLYHCSKRICLPSDSIYSSKFCLLDLNNTNRSPQFYFLSVYLRTYYSLRKYLKPSSLHQSVHRTGTGKKKKKEAEEMAKKENHLRT